MTTIINTPHYIIAVNGTFKCDFLKLDDIYI